MIKEENTEKQPTKKMTTYPLLTTRNRKQNHKTNKEILEE